MNPDTARVLFGAHFDSDRFLREHWQKTPCLIRNPWRAWANPFDPDELAGLACEAGVEARLVTNKVRRWRVEHGPFPEKRFAQAGKHPWTLLVQAVDQVVPAVAALIEPFRFLPHWRIDDVMVSYASDGGGVGPHFDHYDVFLIQGLGRRHWRVGGVCDATTPLLPNEDLRLLAEFNVVHEWLLEPGDILYLPPHVAHDGVAIGDGCMTYSLGFRAPSRTELIAHWCDHLLAELVEDDRYTDPDLVAQANPGEISPDAVDRLYSMVAEKIADRAGFARWFGSYTSTPKYPEAAYAPNAAVSAKALRAAVERGATLGRNPASRFAFVRAEPGAVTLFVDGQVYDCTADTADLAQQLCAGGAIAAGIASDPVLALVTALVAQGSLTIDKT